jgi:GNAT superfamily N-acetyltransferase
VTDYRVVPCTDDLLDQVAKLHHESFGLELALSERYLDWKYKTNPYIEDAALFVALDRAGTVVGMRGFYGTCWNVSGRPVVAPCADDFAIAPEHRNVGLMTHIMRGALEAMMRRGFSQVLNLSGGSTTILQSLAMGWTSLGSQEPVARTNRTQRMRLALEKLPRGRRLRELVRARFPNWAAGGFRHLDAARGAPSSTGVTIEDRARPDVMAALAARLDPGTRVRHVRDAAYFNWRFLNPMREYRFLYHQTNGALDGYLVVNRMPEVQPPRVRHHLVDWEAVSDEIRAALLQTLLDRGRFPAVGAWTGSMSEAEADVLGRFGFEEVEPDLRARGMPCGLIKTLGTGRSYPLPANGSAWEIRLLDTMTG